jgi:hypothetical protein
MFRVIFLGAAAAVLAWLVVSRSLVAFLAANAPETAVGLGSNDPEALLNLAERHLDAVLAGEGGSKLAARPAVASPPPATSDAPAQPGDRLGLWSELAKTVAQAREGNDPEKGPPEASPVLPAAKGMRDQVRIWVETALVSDPINARALRMLGQLALADGDEGRALGYMEAAARRSIQESVAVDWLMHHKHAKKDYAAALYFADALLRTRSQVMGRALPVLARMAETPAARGELERLLAGNPPWRRAFFSALPHAVSDARTPLVLLLALRGTATPPTTADLREYINVLIAHKFYELASYTWLQFLPPEQLGTAGLLFNGSFELALSGLPFDWSLNAGTGATVDIVQRTDQAEQRALFIELGPGRVEFGGVVQTVLLAPGSYRFKGKYRGEINGRRGLLWRIACVDAASPLGQSAMMTGLTTQWKDFEFSFTVPASECRAQQLRLHLDARTPSEQLVSGTAWYDELSISRSN